MGRGKIPWGVGKQAELVKKPNRWRILQTAGFRIWRGEGGMGGTDALESGDHRKRSLIARVVRTPWWSHHDQSGAES